MSTDHPLWGDVLREINIRNAFTVDMSSESQAVYFYGGSDLAYWLRRLRLESPSAADGPIETGIENVFRCSPDDVRRAVEFTESLRVGRKKDASEGDASSDPSTDPSKDASEEDASREDANKDKDRAQAYTAATEKDGASSFCPDHSKAGPSTAMRRDDETTGGWSETCVVS